MKRLISMSVLAIVLIGFSSFLVTSHKTYKFTSADLCGLEEYNVDLMTPAFKMEIVRANVSSAFRYWDGSTSKRKEKIVHEIAPIAVYNYIFNDGLLPSVTIAMAGMESGWCKTSSCKNKKNYFNVKSKNVNCKKGQCSHKVKCSLLYDDEFDKNGNKIKSAFVSFETRWNSFEFHNNLMHTNRYKEALNKKTAKEQIIHIRNAGYATQKKSIYVNRHHRIAKDLAFLDEMAKNLKKELLP